MIDPSTEQIEKAWDILADIVLGEPVRGEALSREARVAIQNAICEAVKLGPPTDAYVIVGLLSYATRTLSVLAANAERMASVHDEAIMRHAQHARWRNLYRLAKRARLTRPLVSNDCTSPSALSLDAGAPDQ